MPMNEVLAAMKARRSCRCYKADKIEQEKLAAIGEAGLQAPNGGGPVHLAVVQNPLLLETLNVAAKEAARNSGIPHLAQLGSDEEFHCLYGAPAAVIVSASESSPCGAQDTAAATQNMLLAAHSLDLGSCWVFFATMAFWGPRAAELHKELQIPDGFKPYASVALGYKGAEDSPAPRALGSVTFIP